MLKKKSQNHPHKFLVLKHEIDSFVIITQLTTLVIVISIKIIFTDFEFCNADYHFTCIKHVYGNFYSLNKYSGKMEGYSMTEMKY